LAGITEFDTIGGISGGSLPALLLASGFEAEQLINEAVNIDFSQLVPAHATKMAIFVALLLRDRFEYTRPKKGVLGSEPLGHYVNMKAAQGPAMQLLGPDGKPLKWPPKFWTMGVVARTQFIFTADGVYQYLKNGQFRKISDEPAPIDIAIRGSCAVPGIIDPAFWLGRAIFDGALSWDGQCPVGVPMRHFNANPADIIACDVGDEHHKFAAAFRWFWSILCGGHCVDHEGPKTPIPPEVLMMEANVWSVRSLQFKLSMDQKWQAVMSGFQEGVIKLSRAGLLTGDRRKLAFDICMDIDKLRALAK
jgi:predicted acylesterase/phospholipase RssA